MLRGSSHRPHLTSTPTNAGFQSLSARLQANLSAGLQSRLDVITRAVAELDDATLTAQMDLRCRELRGMHSPGLKEYKADISSLPVFKRGDDIDRWTEHLFTKTWQHPGSAEIYQFFRELIYLDDDLRLPPPRRILDLVDHRVDPRDASTYVIEGEQRFANGGALSEGAVDHSDADGSIPAPQQPSFSGPPTNPDHWHLGDELEVLLETSQDGDDGTQMLQWVRGYRFWSFSRLRGVQLVPTDSEQIETYPLNRVRLVRSDYRTPTQRDSQSTPLSAIGDADTGVLDSGVYIPGLHEPWMCILMLARVSSRGQTFTRVLAPQLLALIQDSAMREQVAHEGQGYLHRQLLCLYKLEGQSPGLRVIIELNSTDLRYKNPYQLVSSLAKRDLALNKATPEQHKLWEYLKVLDHAVSVERDADWKRVITNIREKALTEFTRAPHMSKQAAADVRKELEQAVGVRKALAAIQKGISVEGKALNTHHSSDKSAQPIKPSGTNLRAPAKPTTAVKAETKTDQQKMCFHYAFNKDGCKRKECRQSTTHTQEAKAAFEASMSKEKLADLKRKYVERLAFYETKNKARDSPQKGRPKEQKGDSRGNRYYVLSKGGGKAMMHYRSGTSNADDTELVIVGKAMMHYRSSTADDPSNGREGSSNDQHVTTSTTLRLSLQDGVILVVRAVFTCINGAFSMMVSLISTVVAAITGPRIPQLQDSSSMPISTEYQSFAGPPPRLTLCHCGHEVAILQATSANVRTENVGRWFARCNRSPQCRFFAWLEVGSPIDMISRAAEIAHPRRLGLSPRGRIYAAPTLQIDDDSAVPAAVPANLPSATVVSLPDRLPDSVQVDVRTFWRRLCQAYDRQDTDQRARVQRQLVKYINEHQDVVGLIPEIVKLCEGVISQELFLKLGRRMPSADAPKQILCVHTPCMRSIMINDQWLEGDRVICSYCAGHDKGPMDLVSCPACEVMAPRMYPQARQDQYDGSGPSGGSSQNSSGNRRPRSPRRHGTSRNSSPQPVRKTTVGTRRGRSAYVTFRQRAAGNSFGTSGTNLSAGVQFMPEEGGKSIAFVQSNDDSLLARVHLEDEVYAEFIGDAIPQEAALAYLTKATQEAAEDRVGEVTRQLKAVKRQQPDTHRWKLSATHSHADLARLMCGLTDTLKNFCGLTESAEQHLEKWLADTCTDTDLVSAKYVERAGLTDKIDKRIRISIGTAKGPDCFQTQGIVEVPIKMRAYGNNIWHTLVRPMHVCDMDDRCLLNVMALQECGWKIVLERNANGDPGNFLMAPDGVIFALHVDECGMPILPTRGAPIARYSKPDVARCEQARASMRRDAYFTHQPQLSSYDSNAQDVYDSESDDEPPARYYAGFDNSGTDQDDSDSDTDQRGLAYVTKAVRNEAAKLRADSAKQRVHKAARGRIVVHTPFSWHSLLHISKKRSAATALQGNTRFKVGGKVKRSEDLTDADLDELEQAAKGCRICKLTKVTAPAARQGKAMHTIDLSEAFDTVELPTSESASNAGPEARPE